MANHYLLHDYGVDHQNIKAATMASTDGPLLKQQVRVRHVMLVQYLHHHSGEKLILSVHAGNGSILLRLSLTTLLGYQYSSSLHKSCGDTIGITL